MLHCKSRKSSKKNIYQVTLFIVLKYLKSSICCFFLACTLLSCHEKNNNPNKQLTLDSFSKLRTKAYDVNSVHIKDEIFRLIKADESKATADHQARRYYLNKGQFIWIDRHGVDGRADSLLTYLRQVGKLGFNPNRFYVSRIERDLLRLRSLCVDTGTANINKVLARLEYYLTKSYLRYATGQRFGYVNPHHLFNHLDTLKHDSVTTIYRELFDVPMQQSGKKFCLSAIRKAGNDSLSTFLREIQPRNPNYLLLYQQLQRCRNANLRKKIICNLERFRWRLERYPGKQEKYVMVNIPSGLLAIVKKDDVMTMKIAYGAQKTKTPLLTSDIKRIDINPQWIVPRSIIDKQIVPHAGDSLYFVNSHFTIKQRKDMRTVPVRRVTAEMLKSGEYAVVQRGGEDNAMGRSVFRFDNHFAVYLHHTSNPEVFRRNYRAITHGCVRVERPLALAIFLLEGRDDKTIEQLKYSLTVDLKELDNQNSSSEAKVDQSLLINCLSVKPEIPLFITYYTAYPGSKGKLLFYDDIYGYDAEILKSLQSYM